MGIEHLKVTAVFTFVLAAASISAPARADTAVLAGGCYWGTEAVFEHLKGVTNVVSGYAGGSARDANYRDVSAERTGHAEAVRIEYDPKQITYADLLLIFFATHDPTEVNRQGPDIGRSYRSAIFPQDDGQAKQAREFIAYVEGKHIYKKPIATRIETGAFYPAEPEMQRYFDRNPSDPYIVTNDKPKIKLLQQKFARFYKG